MVAAAVQWVMRKKHYLLVCLTIVLAWIIYAVWADLNQTLTLQNHELKELTYQYLILVSQNQTLTKQNHKLIDEVQNFADQYQLSMDLNEMLTKDNQQLMEKVMQYETSHGLISMQIYYIEKWMDLIGKLEDHIKHVIRYCKLKKKFYAGSNEMDRLCKLI